MKKHITLSAMAIALLSTANVQAADNIEEMFKDGKVSGQIREFSIIRSIETSAGTGSTRKANAIGGHLKYETAPLSGISLGAAFYTTNGFANQTPSTNYNAVDPTLLGDNNDAYSILGEAYVKVDLKDLGTKTDIKVGRQKLNTPLAGSDDARMLPNLFEAYVLHNKDIPNTTLALAHVTKFAQGTFGRAYNGGTLAATSGYSAADSRTRVGEFVNMGEYALGAGNNSAVTAAAAIYKNGALKVQLWDYYAKDILNAVYAQADFSWNCVLSESIKPFASVQYLGEDEVGNKYAGTVDGNYWGAKLGASIGNLKAYIAYSSTSENDATSGALENAIISPWGGMPAFTQGMVTRHQFLAGTEATKVAGTYNWKDMGINLTTTLYYCDYDMAANNGYTAGDASESGFDFIYKPAAIKNLNLRLRANYADDFNVNGTTGTTTSWDEYRFIVNYNF